MAVILIVEDEKSINNLIVRCLTMTGHSCLTAFTGSEALSLAREKHPDLILLDINLPDMNGFDVKKQITDIPVIYVTARGEITDRIRGLNGGAEDYIIKPFDFQELIARVNVVLRRFQKENASFSLHQVEVYLRDYKVFKNGTEIALTNIDNNINLIDSVRKRLFYSKSLLSDQF